jgi:hypothetical protein
VSETAPTANRRISNAHLTITGAPTVASNTSGAFTLTGVAAGTHTLTAMRGEYETRTVTVTVTNADVTGVQVSMPPSPVIVSEVHDTTLRVGDASCAGTTKPCHIYQTGTHHDGRVEVFIHWNTDDTDFDLELICGDRILLEVSRKAGTIDELNEAVPGGQACQVRVLLNGVSQAYRIFLKYPI